MCQTLLQHIDVSPKRTKFVSSLMAKQLPSYLTTGMKDKRSFSMILTVLFLIIAGFSASAQNLITNGDFTSNATGWTTTGILSYTTHNTTGNVMILNNADAAGTTYVYQWVAATPGQVYTFDGVAATHAVSGTASVKLEFYASNQTTLLGTSSVNNITTTFSTSSWTAFPTITYTAPANTAYIKVLGTSVNRALKWDNLVLTTPCNGTVTGLKFNDMVGTNHVTITSGNTYYLSSLPTTFNLEAITTGTINSMKFTVTGSASSTTVENTTPFNCPGTGTAWTYGAGTYTVLAQVYSLTAAGGTVCNSQTVTFTLAACNNVTSGGTIGSDESLCGVSVDPSNITNTTLPSGGSTNTIEYVWLSSADSGVTFTTISGATNSTYDPGVITQSTWYRRCARRAGCTSYDGESNWVMKEVKTPLTITGSNDTTICAGNSVTLAVAATNASNNCSIYPIVNANVLGGVTNAANSLGTQDSVGATLSRLTSGGAYTRIVNDLGTTIPSGSTLCIRVKKIGTGTANMTLWYGLDGIVPATGTYTSYAVQSFTNTTWQEYCYTVNSACRYIKVTNDVGADFQVDIYYYKCTSACNVTYLWNTSATTSTITVSPASTTTYTVTATRCNGCTAVDNITVNVVNVTANAGVAQTTTCTTPSVTIGTVAVSGTTYSWSPSTGLSSTNVAQPTANPASTTTYTVTATGSNGCSKTSTVTITVNKTPPTANAGSSLNLTCTTPSGTIGSAAISGNTYSWSPATGLSSTTIAQPTASSASNTTYTVTVTGANGCTATSTVLVNVNKTAPTANAGVDKSLNCTTLSTTIGTATVSGNTYAWSAAIGLSSTIIAQPTANPTATSTYTVTVTTTANGCTSTDAVLVSVDNAPPTADAGIDKTLDCNTASTSIGTVAISGNTYLWTPAASGLSSTTIAQPTANPTTTKTYTVTVTGANGCTSTDAVVVNVNTTPPTANAGSPVTLTCTTPSAIIGTAAVSGSTYSWNPSTGLSSGSVAQPTATSTVTTTYTVTVTGSNGCAASSTVIVTVNKTPPTANAGLTQNLTCTTTSASIGSVAISGNTYSWSPATGLSSSTIAQPVASPSSTTIYTVTATGSNGCTATSTVTVNVNNTPPTADAGVDKNLNCITTSTTIGTTAISGNTYLWTPSTNLSSAIIAQPTANPTTTKTYTVTVTGANGCTSTDAVIVNVNTTPPTVDAGIDKSLNCTTTSTTIGTTAVSGSTYAWSPSTGLSSATVAQPTANPAATLTYTVTVTGSNGCSASDAVMVNVNTTPPTADAGIDKNLNCTTTSTTIGTATISGNTYLWTPSANLSSTTIAQPTANPSVTKTYTVTVTGANGCTSTDAVVVNVNNGAPTADAGVDKNLNCTTTSSTIGTVAVSGNTYSWSPSTGLSSATTAQPTANPSSTTTYTVTVTNSNGCASSDVVIVSVNTSSPTADAGPDKNLNCSTTSATIGTVTISGNTYSWSPATGLSSTTVAQPMANPSSSQTYTVTVTGSNGCISADVVVVNVNTTAPTADAGVDKNLNCTTTSSTIGTVAIVGNTYSWSPATGLSSATAAQPTASPASTTSYTLTVTGSNGCNASDVVIVNVNSTPPTADAGIDKNVCVAGSTTIGTASISGNTYSWSPATGLNSTTIAQPISTPASTISYTVTVTGSNGCVSTDVVIVNVNICVVNVSGTVFNDVNALANFNIDGIGLGLPGGIQLYANLVGSTGNIVGTATIAANGTYQISNVPVNLSYTMILSTTQGTIGNLAPLASLPSGWLNIGEDCCDNIGSDGLVNGMTTVIVATSDVPNINFGIQQPPTPGTNVQPLQVNPGGNASVPVPSSAWSGADQSPGIVISLTITSFPTNIESITVNSTVYTPSAFPAAGITIPTNSNGQPNQPIFIDPSDGPVTVHIPYSVTDDGNIVSNPDGFVDLPFYTINISGNVFNDINGPTNVDGAGIGSTSGTPLYASLVNTSGNVVATVMVNSNGTYSFIGVMPNASYTVVLSVTQGVVGTAAPVILLPTGWENVSEDCCDNTGNDGNTNGIISVNLGITNVVNVNFGIRQPLSLGNQVWDDANKDGLKNFGETGIAGATVKLYSDANSDGVPDGASISVTTSDANGNYIFNGLNQGNFIVGVTPPAVVGGTYTSSASGEESNPNLNVDNNDNGIMTNGAETISGTITLLAGTEPTGETPNNASAPDVNANLTLDFGFFNCPNNFAFAPVYLCQGNTINLISLEPAGYTGGVWTDNNGLPVSSTIVGVGSYNYSYTNGTCVAMGALSVGLNIPDYTPTITIAPSAITGTTNVRVIINVSEILNKPSCSDVYILVPRLEPRFTFAYEPTATVMGGIAVANADWQIFTSNPNFYVWKYVGAATFPAEGSSKLGFIGSYDPNSTDGQTTFSVQVFQGSGGETNITNNTDSELLIYFR